MLFLRSLQDYVGGPDHLSMDTLSRLGEEVVNNDVDCYHSGGPQADNDGAKSSGAKGKKQRVGVRQTSPSPSPNTHTCTYSYLHSQ